MTTMSDQLTNSWWPAVEQGVEQGRDALGTMASTLTDTWAQVLRGVTGVGGAGDPAAAGLPRPSDAVDRAFDLSIQVLEMQRALAHAVLDAGMSAAAASPMTRMTDTAARGR